MESEKDLGMDNYRFIQFLKARDHDSIKKDLKFVEYYGTTSPDESLQKLSLLKKARDHVIFLFLVLERFTRISSVPIDKFLIFDIMKFLPSGSFLHFNKEMVKYLNVTRMRFNYSTFTDTIIAECHLCHAFLRSTKWRRSTILLSCFEEADFSFSTKIEDTKFDKVNLTLTIFSDVQLINVEFFQVHAEQISFNAWRIDNIGETSLEDCSFEDSELNFGWFNHNLKLIRTNFIRCNLCYAKFGFETFNDSCYACGCGTYCLEADDSGWKCDTEVMEIDWFDFIGHHVFMNGLEEQLHLPYTQYSHS